MSSVYIESCGVKFKYDSDIDVYDFLKNHQDTIEFPNLIISREENDYTDYLLYRDDFDKKIKYYDNGIEIFFPKENLNAESLVYPASVLIEKRRHEQSCVTFHSACISKNNNAVLLLGKTGSGKTTTAINLCRNYNFKLVSNDRTILKLDKNSDLSAIDGTKFLFLRKESIKRNLPKLLFVFENRKIDSNYSNDKKITDDWSRKIRVLPDELGICLEKHSVPIKQTYIIHIDETQKELVVKNGNTLANRLLIWENLNHSIRATETVIRDKDYNEIGYLPSYDSEKYFKLKQEMAMLITTKLNLQYLSGNIKDVSYYINSMHCEKQKEKILKL